MPRIIKADCLNNGETRGSGTEEMINEMAQYFKKDEEEIRHLVEKVRVPLLDQFMARILIAHLRRRRRLEEKLFDTEGSKRISEIGSAERASDAASDAAISGKIGLMREHLSDMNNVAWIDT